ncbi:MAG: hypothetical protein WAN48_06155 [Actinomycetes bacterium]
MPARRGLALSALGLGSLIAALLGPVAASPASGSVVHVAVSQGSWIGVGPMPHPAESQTMVRLHDGRGLAFASWTSSDAPNCLRTADLFDPTTDTWSTAAPMHRSRCGASAVVLHSGRVLVAGGAVWPTRVHGPSYRRSAEIYDPGTNRWSFTGRMHQRRTGGAMAVLPHGRVLIAGGFHRGGSLAEAEIYDPRGGRWKVTGSLRASRDVSTKSTATLPNGDILVAGGQFEIWNPHWHGYYLSSAERYVVASHRWRPAGDVSGRDNPILFQLPNQQILAIATKGRHVDRYQPATRTWQEIASLPRAMKVKHLSVEGVASVNGMPMVLAGRITCHVSRNLGIGYLWRPRLHRWIRWTMMPRPLDGAAVLNLQDGSTLVAGGVSRYYGCIGGDHIPTRYAYRYHPNL